MHSKNSLSEIPIPEEAVIVFDLDDTLYRERDFVLSGFRAICQTFELPFYYRLVELYDRGERDSFSRILLEGELDLTKEQLVTVYRNHTPTLSLQPGTDSLLRRYREDGHILGILTDGRSFTQRAKIAALGLEGVIDEIVVSEEFGSEKPDERNYLHFANKYPDRAYVYVGDNPRKDFVSANRLGWMTICLLDSGKNVHSQNFNEIPEAYLPLYTILEIV